MYQVLARRFRPQRLDELVGQDAVARTIRNAIAAGRTAHAYLFAGVRGTGKTSVARILAKCLNCEKGPTADPCGTCVPCGEITEGRSIDVLELDAASRTGIDDIRELQEFVSYAPAKDRFKILIIDEVHMLSKSAFNALLKTLEEPPERVVFVLATTELHKVLPTILSRCQLFEFRRVPAREIASHLRRIAETEGIRVSDRTLERVARAGEGSVRDALSILERVLAFCGNEIEDDQALEVLGAFGVETMKELVVALAARDAARLLHALDEIVGEGRDLVHLWGELLSIVRDLALLRASPDSKDLLSRPHEEAIVLAEAGAELTAEDLTRLFHLFAEIEFGLKGSSHPRYVFESALLRAVSLGAVRPIEEVLAALGGGGAVAPEGGAGGTGGEPASPRPTPRSAAPPSETRGTEAATAWIPAFLARVQEERPMVGAALSHAASVEIDGTTLRIRFEDGGRAVGEMLGAEATLGFLREAAAAAAGTSIAIRIDAAPAGAPPSPAPSPRGERDRSEPPSPAGEDRGGSIAERVRRDPGVKRLLEEFGAQIVEVRPLGPIAAEAGHDLRGAEESP